MKPVLLLMLMVAVMSADAGEITVQTIQGDVTVRRGVTESWSVIKSGEALPPDATIKTGAKSSAVLASPGKTIKLPSEVIVDMSDIRDLSQEELMLKLAMEKVRSSSYEWKNNELNIPNTTIVHGSERSIGKPLTENTVAEGVFLLNGTRVLFNSGFFPTCALKTLEVLRRFPSLALQFEHRWLAAEALEKSNLKNEALAEYSALFTSDALTQEQQAKLRTRIEQLKATR